MIDMIDIRQVSELHLRLVDASKRLNQQCLALDQGFFHVHEEYLDATMHAIPVIHIIQSWDGVKKCIGSIMIMMVILMTNLMMMIEEMSTSFRVVKMTRTILINIKVAISTQGGQCITKRNDKTQTNGRYLNAMLEVIGSPSNLAQYGRGR